MHFLLPYVRLELVIREFVKAMRLRQQIKNAGWFN
jgi:hypothetical protein